MLVLRASIWFDASTALLFADVCIPWCSSSRAANFSAKLLNASSFSSRSFWTLSFSACPFYSCAFAKSCFFFAFWYSCSRSRCSASFFCTSATDGPFAGSLPFPRAWFRSELSETSLCTNISSYSLWSYILTFDVIVSFAISHWISFEMAFFWSSSSF